MGGPGPRYIAPPEHASDSVAGVKEAGVHKRKMTLGQAVGIKLESKGAQAGLDLPDGEECKVS